MVRSLRKNNIVDLNFQRDLQEITSFIEGYIDSTYLSQIRNQIFTYKRQCEEAPCKESQLLEAIIPFIEDEYRDKLSNLIQLITYSQMIQKMLPESKSNVSLMRGEKDIDTKHDYMQQAILALFLYKAILWAEEYSNS